jgi:egghead protein (zeste-white 4 protein)
MMRGWNILEGDRVPPLDDSSSQRSSPDTAHEASYDARPLVQGMRAYFPRAALAPASMTRAIAPDTSPGVESATFPGVRVREPQRLDETDGPTGSAEHLARLTLASMRTPRQQAFLSGKLWLYRLWLVGATAALCAVLLWIQSLVGAIPPHPTRAQEIVQWSELLWLTPALLALALWLGWFIFAEVARPDPEPSSAPRTPNPDGIGSRPVRLILRYVTRGDNQAVLREAVKSAHEAFASYPEAKGPYRIEIVSDRSIMLHDARENVAVYVSPKSYLTPNRSRYKARALAYLQAQTAPQEGDWYVYLDEESLVDAALIAGVYRFIAKALIRMARTGKPTPRLIGQGGILYHGGTWFFRGADALRTADDVGRFRLQYALGVPIFGIHGSYIVVSGADDAQLPFDVGARNSLTEDAAWALRAWARGYRFGWVEGYVHEQPPQRMMDFVRQRSRWLSGIRLVLLDREVPLRFRACLGAFTFLWQISFLPFLITIAAFLVHIAPPLWMRLPADFAWATFVLAYFQGADIEARYAARMTAARRRWAPALGHTASLGRRMASWLMACCYIWYALLEAAGVVYSMKPKAGFFVIYKPDLSQTPQAASARKRPQSAKRLRPAQAAPTARRPI